MYVCVWRMACFLSDSKNFSYKNDGATATAAAYS